MTARHRARQHREERRPIDRRPAVLRRAVVPVWQPHYRGSPLIRDGVGLDSAAPAFENAGDYKDAQTRAAHAYHQLDERNRLFTEAQQAENRGDWKGAASAYAGVDTIEPGYKDAGARLIRARGAAFGAERPPRERFVPIV